MDTVVVGGGIAGLLTALRLALAGQEVGVVEADKLGSGATNANHGMLHSGALYVRRHPHIVAACQESRSTFAALLGDEGIATEQVVYVVSPAEADQFLLALSRHGIPHAKVNADAAPELPADTARSNVLVAVEERVTSSRHLIEVIAAECLAAGVSIVTGVAACRIERIAGRVEGVVLCGGERITARHVIVAAGLGTASLLEGVGSRHGRQLKSRLDMMLHLPGASFARGLVFAETDGLVVMPTPRGGALVSFFGGAQPQISARRGFAVDYGKATMLAAETRRRLVPGALKMDGSTVYVAGKTDYISDPHTEKDVVNPGFQVIDHSDEGLAGLYTVVTGKMTLAVHTSLAAARIVLGDDQLELRIEPDRSVPKPASLVAIEPWAELAAS